MNFIIGFMLLALAVCDKKIAWHVISVVDNSIQTQ
jgi:hypothetical protein